MGAVRHFIRASLRNALLRYRQSARTDDSPVLQAFYVAYKVQILVNRLAKLNEAPFKKPDYYFPGYRLFLRLAFFRHLTIFSIKIFILTNISFNDPPFAIKDNDSFFKL